MEAGADEAGRGCLAGPVCAAAVILPRGFSDRWLCDSKALSASRRERMRERIEREAIAWRVAMVPPAVIDAINILRASVLAMQMAVDALPVRPTLLLVDGNCFNTDGGLPYRTIVHGDALYASIAAASILAKTHRDELMETLDREYPGYGWAQNKGYPTENHRCALRRLGITPWHRTDRDSVHSSRGAYPLLGNSASDLRLRLIRYAEQIAAMLLGSGLKLGCSPTVPPRCRFIISLNS